MKSKDFNWQINNSKNKFKIKL